MGREAHEMRPIWVGVEEGAPRDHQSISQSLLNVRVVLGFPSSQGHFRFHPWQGYLSAFRSSEEQDSESLLLAKCICTKVERLGDSSGDFPRGPRCQAV